MILPRSDLFDTVGSPFVEKCYTVGRRVHQASVANDIGEIPREERRPAGTSCCFCRHKRGQINLHSLGPALSIVTVMFLDAHHERNICPDALLMLLSEMARGVVVR